MKHAKALQEAKALFAQQDPCEMAQRTGAIYEAPFIKIKYFGTEVRVQHPCGTLQEAMDESDHVLILQYLNANKMVSPTGKWKSFLELPGGPNHYPPFVKRGLTPLAEKFGADLAFFGDKASTLSGQEIKMGDRGYLIQAFPNLPLAISIWAADDEFPAQANILFDESNIQYLATASLYILGINLSFKMRDEPIISC